MTSRSSPIIETRAVVKHFGGGNLLGASPTVYAVDGVDLAVEKGETFAIVGESGCGKSTLARMLLRLIVPTGGQVLYDGHDLAAVSARQLRAFRAEMQFIFQDPYSSLNPRMTVGALIEEPLLIHTNLSASARRAKAAALLEKVGLMAEHANRYPHEFSGGQRQRIGIARALASGPKLIVGDEPVSALDVSVQAQIINLLEDLKDDFGLTIVIIAHDLAVIRHMSDRVAVMYLGRLVEVAKADELFDRPLHPYTQALMQAIPVPSPGRDRSKARLVGDIPSPVSRPSGCHFHTRCPHAIALCSEQEPVLTDVGGGRSVSCHRWKDIPAAGISSSDLPARTEAAERRFSLYQKLSHQVETATS